MQRKEARGRASDLFATHIELSKGLQVRLREQGLIVIHKAKTDVVSRAEDINPNADAGCSRSFGETKPAKVLCYASRGQFELSELVFQLFLHK